MIKYICVKMMENMEDKLELLRIENLSVEIDGKRIIDKLSLNVSSGEIHVLMGPNGTGKSTLLYALMGHPDYNIVSGKIIFLGKNITEMEVDERARLGMFLSFQNPEEIEGIRVSEFLRYAMAKTSDEKISPVKFAMKLDKEAKKLKMHEDLPFRYVNVGFSGGEKKKMEMLELKMLNPKLALLDEVDSGLDVDATNDVANAIKEYANEDNAVIIVTHHTKILKDLNVDKVHILKDGNIVRSGNKDLVYEIQEEGFVNN